MTTVFARKLRHEGAPALSYYLNDIPLNREIGRTISLSFTGRIQCVNCSRDIKKSFNQGFCFPCSQKLAQCDICILKPELCHFRKGTCREPDWARDNCLREHVVYLANTTGVKVGITRAHKKLERWGDQGAVAALEIARVPERYIAGLVEIELARHVKDKTDWRALIKGEDHSVDLRAEAARLKDLVPADFRQFIVDSAEIQSLTYPVKKYPAKAKSLDLDKAPNVSGIFNGIRGQYVFIDEAAINIRKYGGYELEVEFSG